MRVNDTRSSVRSSTLVPDLSGLAVEAMAPALDAFRQAAAAAAADSCGRSPQCVIAAYLRDDPGLVAGLRLLLDTPATREGEDGPAALLVAFLWLLCEGQALSDLGRRFLTAAILQLDHVALIADVMAGGDDEAA